MNGMGRGGRRLPVYQDLGLRLLLVYLLFIGPFLLAAWAADRVAAQRLQADVRASDLALARAIAQETNITLGYILQAVGRLAEDPAVRQADPQGMALRFAHFLDAHPEVNLVYRLDAGGVMLYHYPEGPVSTVGQSFAFRPYFKRAQRTELPFLSEARISPTTRQAVTTAVVPLWDGNGRFLGVVGANIKLEALSWTLANIATTRSPDEAFQVLILDGEGRVVAHPDPDFLLAEWGVMVPAISQAVLEGREGSQVLRGPDGVERLYSYTPIRSAGWGVIVGRSTEAAFATAQAFHRALWLAAGAFSLFGLLFWLSLSGWVLRPLVTLAAYSRTIGSAETAPEGVVRRLQRLAGRQDQIGHLTRSLQRMERDIRQRMHELQTLLETSAAVVSTLDLDTVLERILAQVERLLGVKKSAILVWDEDRRRFVARASRGLSPGYLARLEVPPDRAYSPTVRAMRTGQMVFVEDVEADPSFRPLLPRARAEGYRAVLVLPLQTAHAPPAALVAYYPEPHRFTDRELSLFTSFAHHAAMAIENAALYARSDRRLQEQTRRLEALIQSMDEGLILEDLQGRIVYANRRIAELCRLTPEDLTAASTEQVLARVCQSAPDPEQALAALRELLANPEKHLCEIRLRQHGRPRYYRVRVFRVTDRRGAYIGRGMIWQDVTADREVDRMKSSLIATVSHELRTPLAAIKGYATTLLAEDVEWDPEAQREFLRTISDETDRLTNLVNNLLDLSRIEGGTLKVCKEPVDLAGLIERAAALVPGLTPERFQVHLPNDLPLVPLDAQRIEVVLRNLLENAVKYGEAGTPITVSVTQEGGEVIVRVMDEGPGIPPEHIPYVFESFYRVEDGLARSRSGAGLGLAIARGFVEAHGGRIWVEPRAKGTCLAFSLPLEEQHEHTAVNHRAGRG